MTTAVVPREQSHVPTFTIVIALMAVVLAVIALAVTLTDGSDVGTRSPTAPVEQVQPVTPAEAPAPAPRANRPTRSAPAFYGCDRVVGINRC
ncbi:MAG TPA: hypothetical protein VNO51_02165 [Ilumatobacteraceae bacterium]|nr:hypothetical protein [Ilumatobacteraceae bacterium]